MRRAFALNPVATRFDPGLPDLLRRRFPGAAVELTQAAGDAGRIAREAVEGGAEVVVACGGDGTFREVASAVGGRAAVGFVPLGTVNLVARELGVPLRPAEAVALVEADPRSAIYGGRCQGEGEPDSKLFFIGVSAGVDADAVHGVSSAAKRRLGRYAYAASFARRLLAPVEPEVAASWEGGACRSGQVVVLKMPLYGGPYRLSDRVSLFRPGLEVVGAGKGRLGVLRLFWSAFRSRPGPLPGGVRAAVAEAALLLPPNGRYQVDGDPFRARRVRTWSDPAPIAAVARPLTTSTAAGTGCSGHRSPGGPHRRRGARGPCPCAR